MLALGRDVGAPHGRGRRGRAVAGGGVATRDRDIPGRLSRGAHLHGEGRLVGPGRAARREPRPLSGDAGGGARGRCAGRRRSAPREIKLMLDDMALVPRAEAALAEDAAGGRAGADRRGPRGRACAPSVHAPNLADAKAAIAARRDRARARRARPDRRRDDRRDEDAAGLLHPDDGHLRVPGGHARASWTECSRIRRAADGLPAETSRAVPRAASTPTATASAIRTSRTSGGVFRRSRENLRKLHAAGVPVALGTDMWAFPGLGVSIEMDLYVQGRPPAARGDPGRDADRGALARRSTATAARSRPGSAPTSGALRRTRCATSRTCGGSRAVYKNGPER